MNEQLAAAEALESFAVSRDAGAQLPRDYAYGIISRATAAAPSDPTVWGVTHWDTTKLGAQPTNDDIVAEAAALALAQAQAAQNALLGAALKAAVMAEWATFTPGQQYYLWGAGQMLLQDIQAGNIAGALTAVGQYPLPAGDTDYPPIVTSITAILNTYAPLFAAVAAATTVAAVQAVAVP